MTTQKRWGVFSSVIGCGLLLLFSECRPANGQEGSPGYQETQGLELAARVSGKPGCNEELLIPPVLSSVNGKPDTLEIDLYIGYQLQRFKVGEKDGKPEYEYARLQSYYTMDPRLPIVRGANDTGTFGPTLRLEPHDELILNLHNRLPQNGAELVYDRELLSVADYSLMNRGQLPQKLIDGLREVERRQAIKFRDSTLLPTAYDVKVTRESLEWVVTWKADAKDAKGRGTAYEKLQIIRKEKPIDTDLDCAIYGINRKIDDVSFLALTTLKPAELQQLVKLELPDNIRKTLSEVEIARNYGEGRLFEGPPGPPGSPPKPTLKAIKPAEEWEVTWPPAQGEPLYDHILVVRGPFRGGAVGFECTLHGVRKLSHDKVVSHDHNEPHDFNRTNLHLHGWQVSPLQDDVLRVVNPSLSSHYHYTLNGHNSGTYWYHPHVHGSTALQVGAGCSGLAIIEGGAGDVDQVPQIKAASTPEHEKPMIFNEIIFNPGQQIWIREEDGKLVLRDVGLAAGYRGLLDSIDAHPPYGTTINGQIKPIITMRPGEVQRWRMLQSGYHSALAFELVESMDRPYDNNLDRRIQFCQFAVDGVNFKRPRMINGVYMASGNRMDVLVKAPQDAAGKTYYLRVLEFQGKGEYLPDQIVPRGSPEGATYLATVKIAGDPLNMDLPPLDKDLPEHHYGFAKLDEAKSVRTRKTEFNIVYVPEKQEVEFQVDGGLFDPNTISVEPAAGTIEAWEVGSSFNIHPFHIHINHFQVAEYWDWQGTLDDPRTPENERKGEYKKYILDPPMWKDTAMVLGPLGPYWNRDERVRLLTKYHPQYTGDLVMHCHILYHEDKGMMQRVRILSEREAAIRNLVPPPAVAADEKRPDAIAGLRTSDSSGAVGAQPTVVADWKLPNARGGTLSNKDLRGTPTLLVFQQGLGCPHCAEQVQNLGKRTKDFNDLHIKIVAVSAEEIPAETVTVFRNAYGVDFPLLVDEKLEVFSAFGCGGIVPRHGVFLLDSLGRAHRITDGETAETDIDKILGKVREVVGSAKSKATPIGAASAGGVPAASD